MRRTFALAVVAAALLGISGSPEISHSKGRKEGVVVLWPRLVPQTDEREMRLLAQQLQERVTQQAVAGRGSAMVDTRPEPERVCPRGGCKATSVSVVIGHQAGGCAIAAVVGPPGEVPGALIPLVGTMDVPDPSLPFRVPPEERMMIREFVPCDRVMEQLDLGPLQATLGAE